MYGFHELVSVDISAGSIVKNAVYKVIRAANAGKHIVVQAAKTTRSSSLQRQVTRPVMISGGRRSACKDTAPDRDFIPGVSFIHSVSDPVFKKKWCIPARGSGCKIRRTVFEVIVPCSSSETGV